MNSSFLLSFGNFSVSKQVGRFNAKFSSVQAVCDSRGNQLECMSCEGWNIVSLFVNVSENRFFTLLYFQEKRKKATGDSSTGIGNAKLKSKDGAVAGSVSERTGKESMASIDGGKDTNRSTKSVSDLYVCRMTISWHHKTIFLCRVGNKYLNRNLRENYKPKSLSELKEKLGKYLIV